MSGWVLVQLPRHWFPATLYYPHTWCWLPPEAAKALAPFSFEEQA